MVGKTILIVDDEEIVRRTLADHLKTAGFHVLTASDGAAAIATVNKKHIDLVVTDLMMEGFDGIQVLEQAKDIDPELPVIIFTGYGDMTSAINALRLGADDYMLKPCDVNELQLRINRCFEKQDLLAELKKQNYVLSQEITAREKAETSLFQANIKLEERVAERTAELEETNIALKVLLKKNDRDREELEEQTVINVRELVTPVLDKLKKSDLGARQKIFIEIIDANLQEIISPFHKSFTTKILKLTPMETQVANLVKLGWTSKEISELINISPATVNVHRKKIRKKIGITNKKQNLRTTLSTRLK